MLILGGIDLANQPPEHGRSFVTFVTKLRIPGHVNNRSGLM
jgi:hypothetical protein